MERENDLRGEVVFLAIDLNESICQRKECWISDIKVEIPSLYNKQQRKKEKLLEKEDTYYDSNWCCNRC